jgi:ABC-type dipeptide/oligopeptide/nickel transport system permease subunit
MGRSGMSKFGGSGMVNMSYSQKNNLMLGLAIAVMLALVGLFMGMIYFGNHPDTLNETFVDPVYWPTILVLMGIVGVVLLISLAYNKKDYFSARVISVLVFLGGMLALYLWWYKINPFLF